MLAIDEVRTRFPYLAQCTYLNTASAGLSWRGQGAAAAEFFDNEKMLGINGMEQWHARADATRAELAALLNVTGSRINFVGSTTEALNLMAHSWPLQPGDEVLVADDEFPSIINAWWSHVARGVHLRRVPIESEAERSTILANAVGPKTRVFAVSHVHWRSGTRVDVARLAAACKQWDCRLIVDGAHAVGAVPIDASAVDAYCAPVFKWLLSGFGLAFLSLGERIASELTPVFRGYSNEAPSRSLLYSHINYPGIYALHASLVHMRTLGWSDIYERVASLARRTAASLRAEGFDVVTPENGHGGIVSFRHPQSSALIGAMAGRAIFVENGDRLVRVSPHFYNNEDEIDLFIDTLKGLVRHRHDNNGSGE